MIVGAHRLLGSKLLVVSAEEEREVQSSLPWRIRYNRLNEKAEKKRGRSEHWIVDLLILGGRRVLVGLSGSGLLGMGAGSEERCAGLCFSLFNKIT